MRQADRPIDGFCSGIGTGGTITGIGEALKEHNPDIVIWAAEPENAAILSGGSIGTHIQMGIGDGIIPKILNQNIYSDICIVTDEEALETARRLASREGIMCGISSGTNVAAGVSGQEIQVPVKLLSQFSRIPPRDIFRRLFLIRLTDGYRLMS